MLSGAIIFLIIAIVSGYIGFKESNPRTLLIAKIVCFIAIIIFLILLATTFFYTPVVPKETINPLL